MPLMINTNVASLNAQRQLVKSGDDLTQAMERLSSGKRINTAADDAAGLAISNRMTSQIMGLNQAVRNANDGISLIQTAEGALDETTNILQRVRELAIQSANGIYDDSNRATLDAEVQQLLAELDRIAETTTFNGQTVLDGSLGNVELQIGSQANETIEFSITAMDSSTLGLGSVTSDLSGGDFDLTTQTGFDDGDVVINGVALGAHDFAADNLEDLLDDINSNVDGVTAEGFNVVQASTTGSGVLENNQVLRITQHSVDGQLPTNYDIQNTATLDELVDTINAKTGGAVEASFDDNGRLVLSNATGGDITIEYDDDITNPGTGFAAVAGPGLATITGIPDAGSDGTETFRGSLSLISETGEPITVTQGANGTDADLATIGFREVVDSSVQGISLDATAQNTALAVGDLSINGTEIAPTTAAEGLQGKVDNINDVSDETGVVASVNTQQSYSYNALVTPVEVAGASAYSAPTSSFQNLTPDNGYTATGGNFSVNNAAFVLTDMAGISSTVTLTGNHGSTADLLADINGDIPQSQVLHAAAAPGGSDPATFFPADFTAGNAFDFTFDVTDQAGNAVTINMNQSVAGANDLVTQINDQLSPDITATGVPAPAVAHDYTGGNQASFNVTDSSGTVTNVVLNTNLTAATITDLVNEINGELGAQQIAPATAGPATQQDFSNNGAIGSTFSVTDGNGTTAAVTLVADYGASSVAQMVTDINTALGTTNVTAELDGSGNIVFNDTSTGAGAMTMAFTSDDDASELETALGFAATTFDDAADVLTGTTSSVRARDDGAGQLEFFSTNGGGITIDGFATAGVTEANTETLFGGGIDLGSAGGTATTAANAIASLDASGDLTFRDMVGGGGNLAVDNFTAVGASFVAGSADALLGMTIEDGSTETAALETTLEAFIDQNGAVGFRDLSGGQGNIQIDATGLAWGGTAGALNDALGFDIEDLSGSGASTGIVYQGAAEAFTVNDVEIDLATAQQDGSISATEIAAAVNAQVATTGVTAYVDDSDVLHFASTEAFTLGDDLNTSGFVANLDPAGTLAAGTHASPVTSGSIVINGFEVGGISLTDLDSAVATINAAQANTGVTATIDANGELQLEANSAITLQVGQTNGIASGAVMGVNFVDIDDDNDPLTTPSVPDGVMDTITVNAGIELRTINDDRPIQIEVTSNGIAATGLLNLNTDISAAINGTSLSSVSIGTQQGAQDTIDVVDSALETINAIRSELGAVNNRLDFTISNLMNVSENTAAARSRILDADFAEESSNLARAQVLQQASQAMLAQANASSQQVLQLLNG